MRRIGIAAIIAAVIAAVLAGTVSGSALAQSLRPAYAPNGASQSAQSVPIKRVLHVQKVTSAIAPKAAPSRAAAVPQSDGAVTAPTYATPAASSSPSNRGVNDFFAAIFAGPIMLSHAFRRNESTYYAAPPGSASPGLCAASLRGAEPGRSA
jgi:hypothetical protein